MRPRIVVALMAALLPTGLAPPVARAQLNGDQVTAAEVREIAREAHVYGFPMVDNLRIQYSSRIEEGRYWSLQLIDLYTHNFDYLGSRTTDNDGGRFLIARPSWEGEAPKGITKVIRCETDLALGMFRTQLFNPADQENVKKIQSEYAVEPLSAFLGEPAPKTALEFFNWLNFGLRGIASKSTRWHVSISPPCATSQSQHRG